MADDLTSIEAIVGIIVIVGGIVWYIIRRKIDMEYAQFFMDYRIKKDFKTIYVGGEPMERQQNECSPPFMVGSTHSRTAKISYF
ncbi:MAG: hypothetical protein HZB92_08685 [Euryarchaeota archaeon]|nr:hypothetical protein [Euryarchaeota archaeon]